MSTKNILISLVGLIIIGSAIYFSMSKRQATGTTPPPPITTETSNDTPTEQTQEPTASASTDEIIDYIADTQQQDESKVVQTVLDASPDTTEVPTINTNF